MSSSNIVTRFPPSPTGFMHIGNARTALFNWLYARHCDGKFVVRIEDTDRKRHSEEAVAAIINGLEWLGLDWDGEIVSQFAQADRHRAVAQELLDKGQAYHCYCSPDELQEMRDAGHGYDRRWRDRPASDAPKDGTPVVRIKAPLDGSSTVKDLVQGNVTVENDHLDDFIILRSDGSPTYMLSVVVDDHDSGVTHIMRGDDHLNNTFRQMIILNAMGWDIPQFAHMPMIHGPDGGKLSKRHGATSLEDLRDMGLLPEAVRNYLLRLGWGHGDDEIISMEQAIEWFDFKGIGKSPAGFDMAKLENLNAHYIREANTQRLIELCLPFYQSRHDIQPDAQAQKRIMNGAEELKSRAKTLLQFVDESVFYAKTAPFTYDEKAQKLLDSDGEQVLAALKTQLEAIDDFTAENIQKTCKIVADELKDGKLGKVAMPLRAALTGVTVSPSIFHAAEILGKDEVIERINAAIAF